MRTALLLMGLAVSTLSFSQDLDPKAKAILDEVSKKTKGYTSMEVEFSMNTESATDKSKKNSQTGKAIIKGNKYVVDLGNQKVFCDGKTIWTYIKNDNEVHVSDVEDADDMMNPSKMMNIWEKGFKYRFVKEETVNGVVLQEINLVPTDLKSKFHTVIVRIDKSKSQVSSVVVKGKKGDTTTFKLSKLTPNVTTTDAQFKFNKADYPGVKVID